MPKKKKECKCSTHKHLMGFDPHMLLIGATRYYTGRMTIAAICFAHELAVSWDDIPENTRNIIKRDLEEEFKRDDEAREEARRNRKDHVCLPLGYDCDRAAWEVVRSHWRER